MADGGLRLRGSGCRLAGHRLPRYICFHRNKLRGHLGTWANSLQAIDHDALANL
jgi:hypothetical protein